ncbi:hypothetical protein LVJ59_17590 [Microbacterium sp. KKR3/1]|uniref:hypothetical protein n=1 Tax=Microbacterium sp. KKR3/1 TaxID=2904241 RepID=UPI001E5D734A|nr:hypothetical protein [Microbacterium sp. KKR3/1]MCE0510864.1 hypothetical protein [Microbacterium sp. KKR3/1]
MHPDARRILSAALEAAEKALTPTGDEREALANLIPLDLVHDRSREGFPKDAFEVADRILAAGFRRTVVPEPSTEAILSDVRSHAERWANRPPTSPYAMGLRDAWRTILSKIDQHHDLASCAWCSSTARGTAIWQGTDQRHPSCGLEEHGLQFESAEPQAEPSDARVEVAARAMFEPDGPGGEYTWAEMVVEDPSRADIWREDARRVLRAASSVTEQGENRGNAD